MPKVRKRSIKKHASQRPDTLPLTGMNDLPGSVVDYTWVPPGYSSEDLSGALFHLVSHNLKWIAQMMGVLVVELLSASRQLLLILVALVAGIVLVAAKTMAVALRLLSRMRRSLTLTRLGGWYEKQVPLSTRAGYTCISRISPVHLNKNDGLIKIHRSPILPDVNHGYQGQEPVSLHCYSVSSNSPSPQYIHECETQPIAQAAMLSPNFRHGPQLATPHTNSSKYSPRHSSIPETFPRRCYYSLPGSRRGSYSELSRNEDGESTNGSHLTQGGGYRWEQASGHDNIYPANDGMQPHRSVWSPRFNPTAETWRGGTASGNQLSHIPERPAPFHTRNRVNNSSLPPPESGWHMASSSHSRPDRQTLDESHDGNHRTSTHLPAFLLGRRHSTSNNSGGKLRRHLLRERLSQIFRPGRSRSNTSYARPNRSGSPVPRTVAHSHTSSTPSIPENVQSVTTNQEHNEQESSLQTPAESPAFPPQHQSDYSQTGEEEQDNLSQLSMSLCSCSDLESHLDYPSPAPPIFPR